MSSEKGGPAMKTITGLLLSVLLFLPTLVSAQAVLTEATITAMAEAMESAIAERDLETFIGYFADDAQIVMDLPETLGGRTTMTVAQYKASIEESWALPVEFVHETQDLRIQLAQDGNTAFVRDVVVQKVYEDGVLVWASSMEEAAEIILVDGKPRVAKVFGKLTVLTAS